MFARAHEQQNPISIINYLFSIMINPFWAFLLNLEITFTKVYNWFLFCNSPLKIQLLLFTSNEQGSLQLQLYFHASPTTRGSIVYIITLSILDSCWNRLKFLSEYYCFKVKLIKNIALINWYILMFEFTLRVTIPEQYARGV